MRVGRSTTPFVAASYLVTVQLDSRTFPAEHVMLDMSSDRWDNLASMGRSC